MMAVRLISASWVHETFDSYFLHMMYIEFTIRASWLVVRLISASWAKKRFDSYFLDMMYVEVNEKFPFRRFERVDGC